MLDTIYLPKLNKLQPTLESTLFKAIEEAGELARAVLHFMPYEHLTPEQLAHCPDASRLLSDVSEELLDVAQTCVTMIFVMEDFYRVTPDELIGAHLEKLRHKGYCYDESVSYRIATQQEYKYLHLPRLAIEKITLLTTVCKIQEELGEFTQFLGKGLGASGEQALLPVETVWSGCAEELLDVAQCCFTMMYILAERYAVNIDELVACHVDKLRRRGYCAI